MPSLKPLLSATNALLGPPTAAGLAQPKGNKEQQLRVWHRFWEAIELQRLLVDNRQEWGVRFTHPMVEALSVREMLALPQGKERIVWASGDATLERIGAVDWTHGEAYSLDVEPYGAILREMEAQSLEALGCPRRDSRPDAEGELEDHLMVALTELLAVLLLAVHQHSKWKGRIILYMGDNQVVIAWLNSRQARHPFASYMLQVLSAVEASHGFFVHSAYLRTYHNVVADALTREDAGEVMKKANLSEMADPSPALHRFLDRGWQRRALIRAGQPEADMNQALRLSDARHSSVVPKVLTVGGALDVCFDDLSEEPKHYAQVLLMWGAKACLPEQDGKLGLLCCTLVPRQNKSQGKILLEEIKSRSPDLVWVDCKHDAGLQELARVLGTEGYWTEVRSVCGRSLEDQVWWKRQVLTATKTDAAPFPWVTADEEPVTPPLAGYPLDWLADDQKVKDECWQSGVLKLDPSMPYLGATRPKPAGSLQYEDGSRGLVWDPRKPLPGLHDGSWKDERKDKLLLLGKGKSGLAARTIQPEEVVALVCAGHVANLSQDEGSVDPGPHLEAAPKSLAKLLALWSLRQQPERDQKVGVCELAWEKETEAALMAWLQENPKRGASSIVGGKRKAKQNLPENERAMKSMSYVLRHGAGTAECPISEEGWVRWIDLERHVSCRKYRSWVLWDAIERDAKDRVIARKDTHHEWWVAAWSGHTIDGVVGPAAEVPREEVPPTLTHGSYKRHTASIQKSGLLRRQRDIHLHDANEHTERWRVDLETRIDIDTQAAMDHGCRFRRTGNHVWLCDQNIPARAITSIKPWDGLEGGLVRELDDDEERAEPSSSSVALNLRRYTGKWGPSLQRRGITEEVVRTAVDIGQNLPAGASGGVVVDVKSEAVEAIREGSVARSAPGTPEGSECDWSGDESEDIGIVQGISAAAPSPEVTKTEEVKEEEVKAEHASSSRVNTAGEATESSENPKRVEVDRPKSEEAVMEEGPIRRRKIKFGSAHLHLLRAVADADQANWTSLQEAINQAPAEAYVKSEFVERLTHLADLRVKSQVAAEKRAAEHASRAKQYTERETEYRAGLNEAMLRLEQMNPVGPRTEVPMITTQRLQQDIDAGKPIWMARREHRARERAAKHRQKEALEARAVRGTRDGPLMDVDPVEGGQAIDAALDESARADLQAFRDSLRTAAQQGRGERGRPPDSDRRRKLKKQRKREKKGHSKDDAERDRNHAIAHATGPWGRQLPAASFSPGWLAFLMILETAMACQDDFGSYEVNFSGSTEKCLLDQIFGAAFDLLFVMGAFVMIREIWKIRVPLALADLRRRFGTKERRMPVTPEMLKWLGDHLDYGKSEEASLLWAALTLGFFFLLRASEYLDVGGPRRVSRPVSQWGEGAQEEQRVATDASLSRDTTGASSSAVQAVSAVQRDGPKEAGLQRGFSDLALSFASLDESLSKCDVDDYFILYYEGHGTVLRDPDFQSAHDEAFVLVDPNGKASPATLFLENDFSTLVLDNFKPETRIILLTDAGHEVPVIDVTREHWRGRHRMGERQATATINDG
eukprot:s607_g7.t1